MSRRILLVCHDYAPVGGGGGNAARHIARGLARLGHKPYVLTTACDGLPPEEESDGVLIRRVGPPRTDMRRLSPGAALRFALSAMRAAPGVVRKHKIEATLAFFSAPGGPVGWWLKRRCGVPFVIALQGGDVPHPAEDGPTWSSRQRERLIKRLWAGAAAVIANSENLAEQARHFDAGRSVPVIPAGADVEGITPKEDYCAGEAVKLLYVGRLERHKGLDVLLPALAKLSSALKWRLELIGDGPEWPVVAALAARFALIDRISIHGWQGWAALPAIYRKADIFVLPSREDGMPAALLEAMATGLPVIATRVPGAGEAVGHGRTGLLVKVDDSDGLADALSEMIMDPGRWEAMGRAGRARIETYYSWTNVADKWLAAIESAISGHAAR